MTQQVTRRVFLGSALAGLGAGYVAAATPPASSLRPELRPADLYKLGAKSAEAIIREHQLDADFAFAVADTKTGEWLECLNEHQGTPPASVTKAITALYALDTLGPDHRFETRLLTTGGIRNGVIQGDLILSGGGDPTLDTNALGQMAANLKAAGIIGVKGQFIVHDGALPRLREIDPMQPDQVGYNPAISGIALNFNRVHFEWKRNGADYRVTMDARSNKYRPDVAMAVMKVRERRAPIYTYEDRDGKDYWTVARGALGNGGARWLPVRRPALYAGEVFATLAGAQGIRLRRPKVSRTLTDATTLVTQQSDPLIDILQGMLRYSTNITAEMVGLAATQKRIGPVVSLKASAAEMNTWASTALGMSAAGLVDHSGLGDDSRLTALDMARALVAAKDSRLRGILKPFLMRNAKSEPMKDHPIKVDAKTGTLNFVSSLAGYMTAKNGREMVFAIFTANQDIRAGISREDRERPQGARTWNRKAKKVQQALIERWALLYDF
jgi:D-alanyl-D-alanine carboxypeptidase/D-alanyl-D-alanine-endopeptidase (penicillin-binding protein 4)